MATETTCPHCGKPVPATALQGICPECMLQAGLADTGEVGLDGLPAAKSTAPPPPGVAEIAPHFPQLEILECLGRGGMGTVYKARQPKLDRFVALKILTRRADSGISDTEFAARFQQEARALARLNHPDIVAVYDFGEAGGYHYLLMEFVDGLTLRQLLQTKKLSPEEALSIVPKICEALQFAHERGIVHRDIKPENILLDKEGRVKIADFGIAKIMTPAGRAGSPLPAEVTPSPGGAHGVSRPTAALTGPKDVIGTPHYMAPEQIERPATVDHRADIYSLGVVFYEMLTGELPLGKFQSPSKKVQVDVRLDEVVLHALEKEPERRYQHASEVKTDVETIAATPSSSRRKEAHSEKTEPGGQKTELDQSLLTSAASMSWVNSARWMARIFGTLLLAFYVFFILAEGLPPIASQPQGVQLNFIALGLMLAGFVAGWKREGTAALLIACGWTLWQISEGRIKWNLFQTPLPVAMLYGFCWWAMRGRRTSVVAGTVIALAVALGLGQLFVPTSVFIRGAVVDAQTGQPVPDAELRLLPRSARALEKGDPANARANQNGRFTLYVGWFTSAKQLAVTAPGYIALTTNLGPPDVGQRNVSRDFALTAMKGTVKDAEEYPAAAPPVVVRTVPEAGAPNVDPALTEIRVTFSTDMLTNHMWAFCQVSAEHFPERTGEIHYVDHRTCVMPVKLQPGRTYALWFNLGPYDSFRDTHHQPALPYPLYFQTRK